MKKVIFLFLILILFCAFKFSFLTNFLFPKKSFGLLKIESVPNEASVFVDDKEVGVAPWGVKEKEAGVHKIKLVSNDLGWEGKVEVAAGTETFTKRILGPSASFSGGISISYQRTKDGDNSTRFAFTVKPENTKVFVDEKEWETPVVANISGGEHKLKFILDGYLTDEIKVETKSGFLLNVDMEMIIDPFGKEIGMEKEEMIIAEGGNVEGLEIIPQAEWGGDVLDISDSKFSLTPWQKIETYSIIYPKLMSVSEFIKGMDFYARNFLGLSGIPFAYLITEDGKIYQGLGIRDFDYSTISESASQRVSGQQELKIGNWKLKIDSGICPIAYLSTSTFEISEAAKQVLTKLQSYLAGPLQPNAKLITALNSISIEPGSIREITLEFQNTGEKTWENSGDKRIFLLTAPLKRVSEFYTKDSWIAVDTITLPQEDRVLPGQTAKFTFSVTAPFYPDTISESFGLLVEGTQQIIKGSEVSLQIEVGGEGLTAVEIKDTPTGFLNIRDGPSTYAKLLGTVYPHEKYLFLAEEAGWYKIRLRDGSEGWVYAKYVEKR